MTRSETESSLPHRRGDHIVSIQNRSRTSVVAMKSYAEAEKLCRRLSLAPEVNARVSARAEPLSGRRIAVSDEGRFQNTSGRIAIRYASRKAICDTCQLRSRCVSRKAPTRIVPPYEHAPVL